MPEVPVESFANPYAPPDQEQSQAAYKRANLSNDDFRKLLMTPRQATANPEAPTAKVIKQPSVAKREDDDKRQKKKSIYSKLKKEEEERQLEWAKKYRDRAKERRDDKNPDYNVVEESLPSTSSYRAVAPAAFVDPSVVAERRKQAIVESKFLGGDIQHTHLVKGLDYVLLDKIKGEISSNKKEKEDDEVIVKEKVVEKDRAREEAAASDDLTFTTALGRNVYRHCFLTRLPVKNELFAPGRMAYVFELDDEEYADSDIPTTLIRSKADCPTMEVTTLTTNDIVINKLTQILSYLRQGVRTGKKGKKRDKGGSNKLGPPTTQLPPQAHQNIFDGVGEYEVKSGASGSSRKQQGSEQPQRNYFDKPKPEPQKQVVRAFPGKDRDESGRGPNPPKRDMQFAGLIDTASVEKEQKKAKADKFGFGVGHHYAECYPGGMEEMDGTYDSDEDADFTKMDMGNKKGPVKRWDFDNDDEYNQYQSKREALPKAAFQYGVKMSEGRKTRRYGGGQGQGKSKEKAKLDREWQQISAILDKRKSSGSAPAPKRSKVSD